MGWSLEMSFSFCSPVVWPSHRYGVLAAGKCNRCATALIGERGPATRVPILRLRWIPTEAASEVGNIALQGPRLGRLEGTVQGRTCRAAAQERTAAQRSHDNLGAETRAGWLLARPCWLQQ
jgi:hypothetical protein